MARHQLRRGRPLPGVDLSLDELRLFGVEQVRSSLEGVGELLQYPWDEAVPRLRGLAVVEAPQQRACLQLGGGVGAPGIAGYERQDQRVQLVVSGAELGRLPCGTGTQWR